MPPLRERREDIVPLAEALLARMGGNMGLTLSPEAADALLAYAFPGNVRELENVLERAVALSSGQRIEVADLRLEPDAVEAVLPGRGAENLDDYLNRLERQAILEALEKTGGNRTAAARLLGVTFRSLRYRLERLGIE